MKAIHIAEFEIIKCGVEFVTGVGKIPGVEELLPHMERNENYVYWIQPKGGSVEQQQACICVNGTYYTLNNKLEKAIFRNVRLTRDFKNYERLVDGTRKLVIPNRLFQEKLRTSNRNVYMNRKNVGLVQPSEAKLRVRTDEEGPQPEQEKLEAKRDPQPDNELKGSDVREMPAKRQRKAKSNTNLSSIVETFKRRKLNVDVNEILSECASVLDKPDFPLIQTPQTFFKSLCEVFEIEFPGVLDCSAVDNIVSSMNLRAKT